MIPPGSDDSSPGESQEPRKRPLTACLPRRNITIPDTLSARTNWDGCAEAQSSEEAPWAGRLWRLKQTCRTIC